MQSMLESLDHFDTKSEDCDRIWILKEIQGITHKFEGTLNVFILLADAWSSYYGCRQSQMQTLQEHLEEFQSLVQVLEHYGAALGADGPYQESIKKQVLDESGNLTNIEVSKRDTALAKPKSIAVAVLKRAFRKRYVALWSELENNFTRGQDQYPADITLNYKPPPFTDVSG